MIRRTVLMFTCLAVMAGLFPTSAVAQSTRPEDFIAQGRAEENSAVTGNKTQTDFEASCPQIPASQGHDGWVWVLPERTFTGPWHARLSSPDAPPVQDVDMYFYDADCTLLSPAVNTADQDWVEESPMPEGTRFIVGNGYLGSPMTLDLRVTWTGTVFTPEDPPVWCEPPVEGPPPPAAEANWPAETPEVTTVGTQSHETIAVAGDHRLFVGGNGGSYTSPDAGATWTQGGEFPATVRSSQFLDDQHGWVGGTFSQIYVTRDGGTTWTACPFTTLSSVAIFDINFLDANTGFIAGKRFGSESPLIYVTHDGGVSWTRQDPAGITSGVITTLEFTDPLNGYAVGPGVAIRTQDGGATWTRMTVGSDLQAIVATPSEIVGTSFYGEVYRSTDLGSTWSRVTGLGCCYASMDYRGGTIFAAGNSGGLASSMDGGLTWREENIGTTHMRDVVAIAPNRAVAVGGGGSVVRYEGKPPPPPPPPLEYAPETDYYFQADGRFTTDAPTATEDEVVVETVLANSVPGEGRDASWSGTLDGALDRIDLTFWHRSEEEVVWGYSRYTLNIWVGEGTARERHRYVFYVSSELGQEPAKVQTGFDGLEIDAKGKPVTIELAGDSAATIHYGSSTHPSGFRINDPKEYFPDCAGDGASGGQLSSMPNDPCLSHQWGLDLIDAPQAWMEGQSTGRGIVVAPLDSGLDVGHPDFACEDKLRIYEDAETVGDGDGPQDGNGHGTHVAGIIGACTNNGDGVAGVAPDSTIMPVQTLDAEGYGTSDSDGNGLYDLADGIRYATDKGAHVINMSLGWGSVASIAVNKATLPEIDEAIAYAVSQGVVVVASAGNSGNPVCGSPSFSEDVICVTSVDRNDQKVGYTSDPNKVDDDGEFGPAVAAPGGTGDDCEGDVLSTMLRTNDFWCTTSAGYESYNGTSMAAPHVSGVAAMLYERLGGERSVDNANIIRDAILSTAVDLGREGVDPVYGSGRVDALAAVRSVAAVAPPVEATELAFTDRSERSGRHSDSAKVELSLRTAAGQPVANAPISLSFAGRTAELFTDATGTVATTLGLEDAPGSYELVATYGGSEGLAPDDATASFVVLKEISTIVVATKRTTTATLRDDDGTPIVGREITFQMDGMEVGRAITNADGVATLSTTRKCTGKCKLTAGFPGDAFYEPVSSA